MLLLYELNIYSDMERPTPMTIRHLKIFIAVYQAESITRAAGQLHMTQPAVSRAIQELERHYGVRLFERLRRRLSITESGRQLYAKALHIVDSFDALEQGLKNWDEFGVLRVGATPTLANTLLPPVLADFGSRHPGLDIRIQVNNGEQLQQLLYDGELDFALIEGAAGRKHLHSEPFAHDRLLLLLPPDDPRKDAPSLVMNDLAGDRFLLRENGSLGRSFIDHVCATHGITLEPSMESISTSAILQAVHAGLGISFLPEGMVRPSIRSGLVATRAIDDEPLTRRNYIIWHDNKFLTASAKELISLLRQAAS